MRSAGIAPDFEVENLVANSTPPAFDRDDIEKLARLKLSILKPRQRETLDLKFGGEEERTLEEVGRFQGVTKAAASHNMITAIEKLREAWNKIPIIRPSLRDTAEE